MIFVTVGTHEQQFNRLIRVVDEMKIKNQIEDDVVIQTGFSTYEPQACKWKDFYPYSDMRKFVNEARIVITHGGPSSFFMPLQIGKVPIVVPRQKKFGEHVNNHQLSFCADIQSKSCNIIVVEDTDTLLDVINRYDSIASTMSVELKSNNAKFCSEFAGIVDGLNIK